MQLFFSCLFIMLISYLQSADYLVIILCTLFICTSTSLYTHTLTRSLSDDPGFVRPDIGRLISFVQVFDETVHPYLIPVFLSFLPSCYFLVLDISDSVVIPVLYLYAIIRGCLFVILQ